MRINSIYIWMLLLGLLTACQELVGPTPKEQQPIVFKSFLKEGSKVTPITRALGGNLTEGYLLGGAWTTDNPYLTGTKTHFYAQGVSDREMSVDGTPKDPNAAQLYWNTDGKTYHTFYAYTANPAETPAGYGWTTIIKYTDGTLFNNRQGVSLWFRQPDDPAKQIDLLAADNSNIVVSLGATSAVNLYFQHRLSKVSIKVFGTGGANLTSCQAKVTYGATAPFGGIGDATWAGIFIVKDATGAYELSSANRLKAPRHTGTYNLGPQFTVTNTQASELDASLAGSMIFIPQQLTTAGWATISLEYSIDGSESRYTAKLDMPAIVQLYPTKEYVFALNLIERSSVLTVAGVKLVDWNSQNEIIDNLPGDYSLSLSATKPTDAQIPADGKSYNIDVVSNRSWTVSKKEGVTVTPSTGSRGTTKVKVDVNEHAGGTVYAVFSTVGAAESMVSSTWMGSQILSHVEIGDKHWALGNLVAKGSNGATIGKSSDAGIYFQFGSLIGYKGGATANNGTGVGHTAPTANAYWAGATFIYASEVMVRPAGMTTAPTIWPASLAVNTWYFGHQTAPYSTSGQDIRSFTGYTTGELATNGIGDPCSYYLGGKWRQPTIAEVGDLINAGWAGAGYKTLNGMPGYYFGKGAVAEDLQTACFVGASGRREMGTGAFEEVGQVGFFWCSSVHSGTHGKALLIRATLAVQDQTTRSYAMPARCIKNK